jgi:uncharacterized membrane protein
MHEVNISASYLVIFGAAIVTYSLRFGGLMLSDKLPKNERFKRFMETLPGTILVALVIPGILSVGFWGIIAGLSTAIYTLKFKNIFIAMSIGVTIVALSRNFS